MENADASLHDRVFGGSVAAVAHEAMHVFMWTMKVVRLSIALLMLVSVLALGIVVAAPALSPSVCVAATVAHDRCDCGLPPPPRRCR